MRDQRGGGSGAGTPLYAPPDQLAGMQCDVRSDLYATGMMLYQMLKGNFPFSTKSLEEVRNWHNNGSRDFGGIDPRISKVLSKCCAIEMDERYRSAEMLIQALENALDSQGWYRLNNDVLRSLQTRVVPSDWDVLLMGGGTPIGNVQKKQTVVASSVYAQVLMGMDVGDDDDDSKDPIVKALREKNWNCWMDWMFMEMLFVRCFCWGRTARQNESYFSCRNRHKVAKIFWSWHESVRDF